MSVIKDANYINQVASIIKSLPLEEKAAKLVLAFVELRLRAVVQEAIKFASLTNQTEVSSEMINLSIRELNFAIESLTTAHHFQLSQHAGEVSGTESNPGKLLFYSNEPIDIDTRLDQLIKIKTRQEKSLHFEWIQKDNKFTLDSPYSSISLVKPYPPFGDESDSPEVQKKQGTDLKESSKKRVVQGILIKEWNNSNMISREVEETIEEYEQIMEEQMRQIDEGEHILGNSRFYNMIGILEKCGNVGLIMPHIIKHIYNSYLLISFNSCLKKNIFVMLLEAMLSNPSVRLDYHKHLVIKILVTFITSSKLSLNMNSDATILRQNAARLLAKVIASNDDSVYPKLKHNLATLLTRELATKLESSDESDTVAYGILTVS